jgi:hypothetical protein
MRVGRAFPTHLWSPHHSGLAGLALCDDAGIWVMFDATRYPAIPSPERECSLGLATTSARSCRTPHNGQRTRSPMAFTGWIRYLSVALMRSDRKNNSSFAGFPVVNIGKPAGPVRLPNGR